MKGGEKKKNNQEGNTNQNGLKKNGLMEGAKAEKFRSVTELAPD
jgi:hypothetical protein